jgi:hypothetical protein
MLKKLLLGVGIGCATALSVGIAFFVSVSLPGGMEEGAIDPLENQSLSTFEELLHSSTLYEEDGQYDVAMGLAKLAMERAVDNTELARAGLRMGQLLYRDHLRGDGAQLDAASSYLQGAMDAMDDPDDKMEIGWELLNVLERAGDKEQFLQYVDTMEALASRELDQIKVWSRIFNYYLAGQGGWQELNEKLITAEQLPLQAPEWHALLKEVQLRAAERLLRDEDWFAQYLGALEGTAPYLLRSTLMQRVQEGLGPMAKSDNEKEREEALIRLAYAHLHVGNYDQANALLKEYLFMDPSEHLKEAMEVMTGIARATGLRGDSKRLASAIVRRFNFDLYSLEDVMHVVDLLEQNGHYDDALYIVYGYFKMNGASSRDSIGLLARSVVLEELTGNRKNAYTQMLQLQTFGPTEDLGMALKRFTDICIERSDYGSAEKWLQHFLSDVPRDSHFYRDALFLMFDTKYWLNRPMLEQLYVGSAAVQNSSGDSRVAPVVLRMSKFVEELNLHQLAVSYYNRIGLLNFFKPSEIDLAVTRNMGEQAMLGKARCLLELNQWAAADHLLRDLVNRTDSPLLKSEAALRWAELSLHFSQKREAERRYDLVDVQMLSPSLQSRYLLGRSRLGDAQQHREYVSLEESVDLLYNLPLDEQRDMTVLFFNETFDELMRKKDERAMRRLIDLAYQSEYEEWIPIQSYLLRMLSDKYDRKTLNELGERLKEESPLAGGAILDLAQTVNRLDELDRKVALHRIKGEKKDDTSEQDSGDDV